MIILISWWSWGHWLVYKLGRPLVILTPCERHSWRYEVVGNWSPPGRLGIFNSLSPLKMAVSLLGTVHQVSHHQDVYKPCLNWLVRNLLFPTSWKCGSFNLRRDSVQVQAVYFKLSLTNFQAQRQWACWKATSNFPGHYNCYASKH